MRMGPGLAIGIATGAMIGLALDNIAIGITTRVGIGVALGARFRRKGKGEGE
jgi:hypothetical protein